MLLLNVAVLVSTALAVNSEDDTVYKGPATFFYQGGNAGSCGNYHADTDLVVAISSASPFNYNEFCGRTVTITNVSGTNNSDGTGNTITATVADECLEGDGSQCEPSHLDLSTGAFMALTNGELDPPGELSIEWYFN